MITILILAILIALGVGAIRRYRASVAMSTAEHHLFNDLQSTTRQLSRSSGCPHTGVTRTAPGIANPAITLEARIIRKVSGLALEVVQEYIVSDQGGTAWPLTVQNVTLLPHIDYTPLTAQGLALEIGQETAGNFTQLFCVPYEPDGSLYTDPNQTTGTKTGSFVLNNDYSKSLLEIAPTGNAKLTENV